MSDVSNAGIMLAMQV